MNRLARCVAGATLVLFRPHGLAAQQDTAAIALPDIVVSEARVPLPASSVTEAVTVLSGPELRARGLHLVQEALRDVPGFAVVQQGSFGGITSVFTRGGESDYVKVFVDGIAVNEPGGAYDFSSLTLDDVARIEVVRGPASVTYGSDAVTGVVRIFTRDGGGPLRGTLEARAGTFGTTEGRAEARGRLGAAAWSAGATMLGSDGTYAFNNDFRDAGITGRLTVHPDGRSDVAVTTRIGRSTAHFPTDGAGISSDSNQFTRGRNALLGIDGGRQLTGALALRGSAGIAWHALRFDDQPDSPGDTTGFGYASRRDSRAIRWNVDGRVIAHPTTRTMVSAGAQFERQLLRTSASYTSNFGAGTTTDSDPVLDRGRNDGAAYLEARAAPIDGLTITASGRVDHDQAFGTFGTWRAGVRYGLPGGFSVRGSAGSGFKAPSFAENYANTPYEVGNPDLEPERSTSWEGAVEYGVSGGRLTLSLTYFDQRFRHLIQYVGAAPGEPTYQNLGAALARGAELGGAVRLAPGWHLGVAETWLTTRVTDAGASTSPAFESGASLIRRPGASGSAWLQGVIAGRARMDLRVRHVGSRADVDFSSFPSTRVVLDPYTLLEAAVDLELLHGEGARPTISALARGENLLNEGYETVRGFPGRGRTVLAGFGLAW